MATRIRRDRKKGREDGAHVLLYQKHDLNFDPSKFGEEELQSFYEYRKKVVRVQYKLRKAERGQERMRLADQRAA